VGYAGWGTANTTAPQQPLRPPGTNSWQRPARPAAGVVDNLPRHRPVLEEAALSTPRLSSRLVRDLGVGVAGLALGLGIAVALHHDRAPGPTPSVQRLELGAGPAAEPAPAEPAGKPVSAPSAQAAVQRFFEASARQDFTTSYELLDPAGRARYRSLADWTNAQADRAPVTRVRVEATRPSGADAAEVTVELDHPPAVDPFVGLTPGHTVEVWRAHRDRGRWLVAADPVSVRPVLPADAGAPTAVRDWVDRLARCDTKAASALQATTELYGPLSLPEAPCRRRGAWTVGAVQGLDAASEPQPYVAAFGPNVRAWARLVPVQGPGTRFNAVVAPLGDNWRVLGTDPATPTG
jgi:hypothetical protein